MRPRLALDPRYLVDPPFRDREHACLQGLRCTPASAKVLGVEGTISDSIIKVLDALTSSLYRRSSSLLLQEWGTCGTAIIDSNQTLAFMKLKIT